MGDYICWNEEGIINEKHYSVDGADLDIRPNCMKIDRNVFKTITKYHKVVDGKIVEMTQEEKDVLDAPAIAEKEARDNLILSIKTKLKGLGLTDEEADFIIDI